MKSELGNENELEIHHGYTTRGKTNTIFDYLLGTCKASIAIHAVLFLMRREEEKSESLIYFLSPLSLMHTSFVSLSLFSHAYIRSLSLSLSLYIYIYIYIYMTCILNIIYTV